MSGLESYNEAMCWLAEKYGVTVKEADDIFMASHSPHYKHKDFTEYDFEQDKKAKKVFASIKLRTLREQEASGIYA